MQMQPMSKVEWFDAFGLLIAIVGMTFAFLIDDADAGFLAVILAGVVILCSELFSDWSSKWTRYRTSSSRG